MPSSASRAVARAVIALAMTVFCLASSRGPRAGSNYQAPDDLSSLRGPSPFHDGPKQPRVPNYFWLTVHAAERPRARDLGITPGVLQPGLLNAITDVAGVRVGQLTLIAGDRVRTGVTAILPHGGNLFQDKVPGAVFIGNAFGKLAGSTQVEELGTIETPIVLSNTLAVGTAVDALVAWTLAQPGNESVRSVNALVGETNDGGLNDIRSQPVRKEHVLAALRDAREGAVAEGGVGAGTGTIAFGFKGGIGTSSRLAPVDGRSYVVGVLVQTNFGGVLSIDGAPAGKEWGRGGAKTSDSGGRGFATGNGSSR